MANFLESPRFPDQISYGVSFGPEFITNIGANETGIEQRDKKRDRGLCVGECSHAIKSEEDLKELLIFFRSVKGRWTGFRFKDWVDFQIAPSESYFAIIDGASDKVQLSKLYQIASEYAELRPIICPVLSTFELFDGIVPVTAGVGAGQYAIDNSGVITLVALQTRTVASHTVGAAHRFTLSSALSPNVTVGQEVGITGVTGTAASLLNDKRHEVTIVSGTNITVATGTAGLAASGGTLSLYRQRSDLNAVTEFDVPCRFDTDRMAANFAAYNQYTWGQILLQELRSK